MSTNALQLKVKVDIERKEKKESQQELQKNQKYTKTHMIPDSEKEINKFPLRLKNKNKVLKLPCAEDEDNWHCTNKKRKAIPKNAEVLRRHSKSNSEKGRKTCNPCKPSKDACTEETEHAKEYNELNVKSIFEKNKRARTYQAILLTKK